MRTLRVALAQMNPTMGDLARNTERILQHIEDARSRGVDVVAFPELCITGYPPEDLLYKPLFIAEARRSLDRIVEASQGLTVVVGFPEKGDKERELYNAAAVIHDGALVDVYRKIFLPNYSVFDEERYFEPGERCPVYRIGDAVIGVNICEDIWYGFGPTNVQRAAGAEAIININGSPYYRGKRHVRHEMLSKRAAENGLFVCYVNMIGGQDELVFDGDSKVFDAAGGLVTEGAQFDEDFVVVDLDLDSVSTESPTGVSDRDEGVDARWARPDTVEVVGGVRRSERTPLEARPEYEPLDAVAEVHEALVLGTRDYVRKSGFEKVVIGLSGGVDSALTVVVAVDALGPENVLCVTMPSEFSSRGSMDDSADLVRNLGARLETIPISETFDSYKEMLSRVFAGTESGVAEENLQARIRGNILMGISNKFGWLVLSTGNKSEYAMGYTTLYGDMAGGFAVIKDVPKTLVYEVCEYRNRKAGWDLIPRPIIEKPPSAELRPDQLDTDSLPPYDLLDPVLEAYVERDVAPQELVAMGFDEAVVRRAVELVDRSEYKRRQAPPGVKITERAFGKDRRLPIVSRFRGL